MRIAYIAPYQGPTVVQRRPITRNLSLAGRVKVERVAELLQMNGHEVEIISQGEVIERRLRIYQGFAEEKLFNCRIPVFYASAFPIPFLNGSWSSVSTLHIFRARHMLSPYDAVVIYNLKPPQVICARHAIRRLKLPVILEYEDDLFVDRRGKENKRLTSEFFRAAAKNLLSSVSACMGVSPHLLAQVPSSIPKMLLRGVVGDEIIGAASQASSSRKNWVVFSGTHAWTYGLEQLIRAWEMVDLPGWELHIAGCGEMTTTLERLARGKKGIVFHGLLNRNENAQFLCSAKIGINPHDLSENPGHIFAFKIIEYLTAGIHVLTTPMGALEPEIERGVTYLPDNRSETIAASLKEVIQSRRYEQTAAEAALKSYGPAAVASSLQNLLYHATNRRIEEREGARQTLPLGSTGIGYKTKGVISH
jgi:glycosyltransferase involved in cell wall biosynthesis